MNGSKTKRQRRAKNYSLISFKSNYKRLVLMSRSLRRKKKSSKYPFFLMEVCAMDHQRSNTNKHNLDSNSIYVFWCYRMALYNVSDCGKKSIGKYALNTSCRESNSKLSLRPEYHKVSSYEIFHKYRIT